MQRNRVLAGFRKSAPGLICGKISKLKLNEMNK